MPHDSHSLGGRIYLFLDSNFLKGMISPWIRVSLEECCALDSYYLEEGFTPELDSFERECGLLEPYSLGGRLFPKTRVF